MIEQPLLKKSFRFCGLLLYLHESLQIHPRVEQEIKCYFYDFAHSL